MLHRLLPARVKSMIKECLPNYFFSQRIYSQEGEDAILMRIFDSVETGFYVDIGAHHPFRFSNTFAFYKRGWNGIVVDPLPGVAAKFAKYRPRDIAVEKGISTHHKTMKYYAFHEGALNTFDETLANERIESNRWPLKQTIDVQCVSLKAILDEHLPHQAHPINFLSVDVEGLDLEVLKSNDWSKYRPSVIVAECLNTTLQNIESDPLATFLRLMGYTALAKTFNSVIFRNDEIT